MEEFFLNDFVISMADKSNQKDLYNFQTKNHLEISPNDNIKQAQIRDIPIFLTRLIDVNIFVKVKFWILTRKEDRKTIVASIGLEDDPKDKDSVELNTFSVCPSLRNKGIGTELLKYTLNKAKELGYKRVFLVSTNYMKVAWSLYTKFGFKKYDIIYIKVEKGISIVIKEEKEYNEYEGDKFTATYFELYL